MIENALASRLSGFAGLAALVGARIYPILLPQDCPLPALTYKRVAAPLREPLLSRDSGEVWAHFEVAVWSEAPAYDQLCAIAQQVRLALQRWAAEADGVNDTFILNEEEDYQPEAVCFYRVLTVEVDYQEEIPD